MNNYIWPIAVPVVLLLGLLLVFMFPATQSEEMDQSTDTTASEAVGVVTDIDLSQMPVDGPARITLETTEGNVVVAIPSMGINLCEAVDNIVGIDSFETGDTIAVYGRRQSDGTIVPCESANHYFLPQQDPDAQSLTLSVGEQLRQKGVVVRFDEMVQDSRCGIDEDCQEAGGVTAKLTLIHDGEVITTNIASDEVPYTFAGHAISIIDVQPDRLVGQDISANDYRLTISIDSRSAGDE